VFRFAQHDVQPGWSSVFIFVMANFYMSDINSYQNWLSTREHHWESLCLNCGACCGAKEDPCEHLVMTPDGKSSCKVYMTRLGPQKTVSGHAFNCISIRQKMGETWPGDDRCPYRKL
jgi:uncharacterized cysteine cluster protein YcgN (CxxCxxCC family)